MASRDAPCNVAVLCRFRPLNDLENERGGRTCATFDDEEKSVEVTSEALERFGSSGVSSSADAHGRTFTFDKVFSPLATQRDVYLAAAKPQVEEALRGYNCTIFAYGQTGSGKTHTMMGPSGGDVGVEDDLKGIIPRIAGELFAAVERADADTEFTLRVSFMEIYMERLRDLLGSSASGSASKLRIREDRARGLYVEGATEVYVGNVEEMMELMATGSAHRAIASTRMNQDSSRSHSVFTIKIGQKNMRTQVNKNSKLVLIDLAGSEMVKKTKASGSTLDEAKMINKSLSALGNVIKALVKGQPHIPYRDSKLTRLLQDSLGGNSKTSLIIACSSSDYNVTETLSTLRFGSRAKNIKNKPVVNEEFSIAEYKAMLEKANKTIEKLRGGAVSPPRPPAGDAAVDEPPASAKLSEALQRIEFLEGEVEERDVELAVVKQAVNGHLERISELDQVLVDKEQELRALRQEMDGDKLELKQREFQLNEIALGKLNDMDPIEMMGPKSKLSAATSNFAFSPHFSDDESDGEYSGEEVSGANALAPRSNSAPIRTRSNSQYVQLEQDVVALTKQTVDLRMELMQANEDLANLGDASMQDIVYQLRAAQKTLSTESAHASAALAQSQKAEHECQMTRLMLLNRDEHIAFLETAIKSQQDEFKRCMRKIDAEYKERVKELASYKSVLNQIDAAGDATAADSSRSILLTRRTSSLPFTPPRLVKPVPMRGGYSSPQVLAGKEYLEKNKRDKKKSPSSPFSIFRKRFEETIGPWVGSKSPRNKSGKKSL